MTKHNHFLLLRISTCFILMLLLNSCTSNDPNKEAWISLFNGKDLTNWDIKIAGLDINDNYKNTFTVKNSILSIRYNEYTNFDNKFGHLYYNKPFSYYKLAFDYRFTGTQTKGGNKWNVRNSGVMLHSQSAKSNAYHQNFPVSIELQLLGGLDDNKERTTGNVCTPGTAVVMGDTINFKHCISSDSKTYYGDRWVHAEAIVLGGESMTFIIEKDTVLNLKAPQIGATIPNKQYKGEQWEKWGMNPDDWNTKDGQLLTEGYIALQAESHPVDFKNIELLDLCGCKDPKAKNYKSYFVKNDASKCEYK
ncbi:3-keto-disaccharide hydrolase [Wenyingzhuangia sp. IMCC45574]